MQGLSSLGILKVVPQVTLDIIMKVVYSWGVGTSKTGRLTSSPTLDETAEA